MKTIALISSKGGTGKSTIATNLAVAAHSEGVKSIILDLDPQASASIWKTQRQEDPEVETANIPLLGRKLKQLEEAGVELAIVDTPGQLVVDLLEGIDFALVPTEHTFFASHGTAQSLRFLTGRIPFAIVFNQVHHAKNMETVLEPLRAAEVEVAPTIRERAEYVDAPGEGKGVLEYSPKSKAAQEIRELYDWLKQRLGM